jgi:hypothetical protein
MFKWHSFAALLLVVLCWYQFVEAIDWTFERITTNTVNEADVCIATDSQGKTHIAYLTQVPGGIGVYYITNKSGSWFGSFVDSMVVSSSGLWIDLGENDSAYICYTKTDNNIWFADNPTGSWITQQVTNDQGYSPSMAIDNNNKAHIFYRNSLGNVNNLYYTHNMQGIWNFYQVTHDTAHIFTLTYPGNIDVDDAQKAHVVYYYYNAYGDSNYHVIYANNISGDWDTSWVPGDENRDILPIIDLDADGDAHITYGHGTPGNYDIYYANNITGVWVATDISALYKHQGPYPFCLDNNGHGHIVYLSQTSPADIYRLYYATNISGSWTNELIPADSINIGYMWFTIDNEGYGHVAYCMTDTAGTYDFELWYAKSNTPLGISEDKNPNPIATSILQSKPNPFRQSTNISYHLDKPGRVTIKIFNITGQLQSTLIDRDHEPGDYSVHWDGTDDKGGRVSCGIYLCQFETDKGLGARTRMIFVK